MFELEGAQYEKGKFELRLGKKLAGPLKLLMSIGSIRGRFVVLAILLVTAFATVQRQPAALFITNAWVSSPEEAQRVQSIFSWGMCGVAVVLWMLFFVFRQETLLMVWDKTKLELKTHFVPKINQQPEITNLFPFKDVLEIKVFGPDRAPQTPHGYLQVRAKDSDGVEKVFEFQFLTDEQAKFFPLNIYRISQILPVGDWVDSDSEIPT